MDASLNKRISRHVMSKYYILAFSDVRILCGVSQVDETSMNILNKEFFQFLLIKSAKRVGLWTKCNTAHDVDDANSSTRLFPIRSKHERNSLNRVILVCSRPTNNVSC